MLVIFNFSTRDSSRNLCRNPRQPYSRADLLSLWPSERAYRSVTKTRYPPGDHRPQTAPATSALDDPPTTTYKIQRDGCGTNWQNPELKSNEEKGRKVDRKERIRIMRICCSSGAPTTDGSVLVALGYVLPVDPSPNPAVHRIDNADKVVSLIPPEYPRWLPIVQAHGHLGRFYRLMRTDPQQVLAMCRRSAVLA
jgi:hypothetical protein